MKPPFGYGCAVVFWFAGLITLLGFAVLRGGWWWPAAIAVAVTLGLFMVEMDRRYHP